MLSEAETSYYKHVLLGKTKKFFKDLFAKGPEELNIKISDDIIIMQFAGILRKAESDMVAEKVDKSGIVLAYRNALFESNKDCFFQEVETVLKRKIVSSVFDIDVSQNTALCLIILNKPV